MRGSYTVVALSERGQQGQGRQVQGRQVQSWLGQGRLGQSRLVRVPQHREGRHRLGAPGTRPLAHHQVSRLRERDALRRRARHRPAFLSRGRHRHTPPPTVRATRYSTLVVLLATVAVSTWFTATGAAALAQMLT